MKKLFALLVLSTPLFAAFEFVGDPYKTISVEGVEVPIYREVDVTLGETTTRLYLTGSGIRAKKVIFTKYNVYVIASYIDSPIAVDPSNPMQSVENSSVKLLHLTLVNNVTADQIRGGFEDSLNANNVSLEDPGIQKLMSEIDFDLAQRETTVFIGYHEPDGTQTILTESPQKVFRSNSLDLADNFWKCWFNIPVDAYMAELKKELIGPPSR